MTAEGPPGVDPDLWAEFQRISAEVHRLNHAGRLNDETPAKPWRMVIDVPAEWVLFASWMEARRIRRQYGKNGPTHIEPYDLNHERLMRGLAKQHIAWALNEYFHQELHLHCTGNGWLLRPEAEKPKEEQKPFYDLDDEIPF